MIAQIGDALRVFVYYVKDGSGVTGLTVTLTAYDASLNVIVNAQNATEHALGFYYYDIPSGEVDEEGTFVGRFTTAGDVDTADIPVAWYVGVAGVENLDHSIATVDGVADSILEDTAEIGAAGAGLTDLGGMSTAMKAEVNAEADTALADYDAPTKAELDSAVAPLAQEATVDGLENLSQAEAQTAAAAALTAYDPPTKAELDSGLDGLNDLDAAGVRGAVGLAAANLDTQLGDLPTNAELAAALAAADDAVLNAIDALNDLSAAQVNAEVDTAIADAALATAAALQTAQTAITAVKGKTDQLTFSNSAVDANMERINDVEIAGAGVAGNKFEPV